MTHAETGTGILVNDVHSGLNPSRVERIVAPESIEDIQAALACASARQQSVAICGGRHAMGGQQFGEGALLLDMRSMDRVLMFDRANGLIAVEAGMQWPALIDYLESDLAEPKWSIRQKQTGADTLSLGGCLSANVHGRGLRMQPFIADVESFMLVDADGRLQSCNRQENAHLFRLAIGGCGLFGVIASVTLRLMRRRKMRRDVVLLALDGLMDAFAQRITAGYAYGDFQFAIDPQSSGFMQQGVFSCYCPVPDDSPLCEEARNLTEQDWRDLLALAHCDKAAAFDCYARHYLATHGQVYWSDRLQQSVYLNGYHEEIDARLGHEGSEMIGEIYVPHERLVDFMRAAAEDFRIHQVDLIYGTIRLIRRDQESFLPWARRDYACIIFNLHTPHSAAGIEATAQAFRRLIDMAIARDGSYYLTYHRYADRRQMAACYPGFAEFLQWKRLLDPDERFTSNWYRHCRNLFAEPQEQVA